MRLLSEKEVKEQLFVMLSDFADFCDANGLRYYLSGGTLLGAIRHKGFIPWDDDVDLLMPRPDFEKMHSLLKNKKIKPYYGLIGYNAGNDIWPFAKIVDERTSVFSEYSYSDKQLWLDIFPMDGLPDDLIASNNLLSIAPRLKINYARAYAKIGKGKTLFRTLVKIPAALFLKYYGLKRITKKLDTAAKKYSFEESTFVGGIAWSLGPKERMKREEYTPVVDVEFNGRMFHAPACWEKYLTSLYGDYMTLPPEEKRINHGNMIYMIE